MHLTPEQIDRQPFRMTRRGYDIVQVRNFLREIAAEMRARQEVRERLAEAPSGEESAVVEDAAHHILVEARAKAAKIVKAAEAKAGSAYALFTADARAHDVVSAAEVEAAALIDAAELTARDRSDAVLSAAQARLDQLLEEERTVHARVESARAELEAPEPDRALVDSRDVVAVEMVPDTSLADFMKSTLRHEVHPTE
jgi:DivIVA domain-containing protein